MPIREAQLNDLSALIDLENKCFDTDKRQSQISIKRSIKSEFQDIFVLEELGHIIESMTLYLTPSLKPCLTGLKVREATSKRKPKKTPEANASGVLFKGGTQPQSERQLWHCFSLKRCWTLKIHHQLRL